MMNIHPSKPPGWTVVALLLTALLPVAARAQDRAGAVAGRVLDAQTGEPVAFTQVLLEEIGRSDVADEEGRFVITDLRAGAYTLKTFRIGYAQIARRVTVPPGDTLRLVLHLAASPVVAGEVIIEGTRAEAGQLAETDAALQDRTLRRNLGTTVAETLEGLPGLSMRSMGPAPARPVLRGLGGARLLILEDGGRTGDLSHTSSDHALAIDPLTADRLEVLRGPAVLMYGPNVLAGAINVERGYVPTSRPDAVRAELTTQAASVNRSYAAGLALRAPVGPFAVQADGSVRQAQNMHTPVGILENTSLATYNGSAGVSRVTDWGFAGVAGSYYQSDYGIPGGFVGAHPNGVSITLERYFLETRGAYLPPATWVQRLEVQGSYARYHHKEFEASDILGIAFGVVSYHGSATAYTGALGPFSKGAFGVWGEYRNYASSGLSFTPQSIERTLAGFLYQEAVWDPFTLKAGARYDLRVVQPSREYEADIGYIRDRSFGGVSAALAGSWQATPALSAGLRLMHSLRMPSIEELYSQGPHLAAYTFQVGHPGLEMEKGWGVEVFADYQTPRLTGSVALFYNYFGSYIFPRNTGQPSRVQLPIYQYTGATARMAGGEASITWRQGPHLTVDGSVSYVRGTLTETDTPLPQIPPLQGTLGLRYTWDALTLGASTHAAAPQNRVNIFTDPATEGIAEVPTDGHVVLNTSAQYHVTTGHMLHTFSLGVENVFNTEYRDHLSRVRVIMPEPGRNVTLLYRVHF